LFKNCYSIYTNKPKGTVNTENNIKNIDMAASDYTCPIRAGFAYYDTAGMYMPGVPCLRVKTFYRDTETHWYSPKKKFSQKLE